MDDERVVVCLPFFLCKDNVSNSFDVQEKKNLFIRYVSSRCYSISDIIIRTLLKNGIKLSIILKNKK